ncbi:UbiX family flavin prenyltransferase [Actinophytocola sp.]|uniref:UbiX family flavin prenyltransferase n=1 Tax=Actinophytocola sp. TaxID=1872138 RepID=UPI002D7FB18E|nr:UbiX family flavin prenyltransferase [Actinophytocola sp.]HET9139448.1 UbiX family flavin prenyltransferase [Actinophytocola sp.]
MSVPGRDTPANGNGQAPGGRRVLVAMTGATGAILGIRLLEAMRELGVETHLVLSEWAERTIRIETDYTVPQVRGLASIFYQRGNQAAPVSSGSFPMHGMAIIPCSMNTLAALAHGLASELIVRAADVMLKERRTLVLVPRETPLNAIHLRNMLLLSELGVSIVPPMPAFYNHPRSVDDIVGHIVARVLDQFGIDNDLTTRWGISQHLHTMAALARAGVAPDGQSRQEPS